MDDMRDVISSADIVYTATSAADYLVEKESLEANGLAGGKPICWILFKKISGMHTVQYERREK
jgi:ornithine cyclodeaminase/alanine dehydrogenase-like protein (mu-crystallin family)